MKITVTAKPNAKEERVEEISPTHFSISVKEPPRQGKANHAILKALAKHLNVPPSRLEIVSGHTSRQKIIHVNMPASQ